MNLPLPAAAPALSQLLRELSHLQLPPRGELSTEAWLAVCRQVLPQATWVRLAMATLAPQSPR